MISLIWIDNIEEQTVMMISRKIKMLLLALLSSLASTFTANAQLVFSQHFNGAMRIDSNSTWIYVEGEIASGDAKRFKEFLEDQGYWGNQRVVFNSTGGNVIDGIMIGSLIRQKGFRTFVAKTVPSGDYSDIAPGMCASACVLAFAGGVERYIMEDSDVGVHQMSRNFDDLEISQSVTVADLIESMSTTQLLIGLTLRHFLEMGLDPNIVSLMMGTSFDEMRWLNRNEMEATKILFLPSSFLPWNIEAYKDGIVAYSRSQDGMKQLTVFCRRENELRFRLSAEGFPYAEGTETLKGLRGFDLLGVEFFSEDFDLKRDRNSLIVTGVFPSAPSISEFTSTWNLFGRVSGSIADLYSLYDFNQSGFRQSVALAQKNCI